MNPYIRNLLAALGVVPVILDAAYPAAHWTEALSAGILVLLAAFHVTPITLASPPPPAAEVQTPVPADPGVPNAG